MFVLFCSHACRHTFDSENPSPLLPYHSLLAQVRTHLITLISQSLPFINFTKQVVDAIFRPSKPDLPDLDYHSHGLADILKSSIR